MKNCNIEIRRLEPADWDNICRIYEAATVQELVGSGVDPEFFRPMPEEEPKEKFFEVNSSLAACEKGRIVGFAAWREGGYLSWLYVDPAYQRRGIGTRLLKEAMSQMGPQGWTLAKKGGPAVALYQKHGMEIVKSQVREYHGCPFMELRLALPTSRKHDPKVPSFGIGT